ncbi:high affinity copper uptake protein 1-like [Prorops nasuta]|uniref:high affinity copper uptake protein 1-like n=1 Tax=Prorops nasuta TaxID=863751 RepID=UPI0034CE655E
MDSMAFHFGINETILFKQWYIKDVAGMIYSIIGLMLLSIIYEALKSYRDHLYVYTALLKKHEGRKSRTSLLFSDVHLLQTLMHILQMIVGYMLMLVFMTYNVWICMAVIVGTAFGYWLFSWRKSYSESDECCS